MALDLTASELYQMNQKVYYILCQIIIKFINFLFYILIQQKYEFDLPLLRSLLCR